MTRTGMLLAGIALLIFILLRRTFRYYGGRRLRGKVDEPYLMQTPRPAREHRSLSTAPSDVLRWQVEMHDTVREMKAELDSKMRLLQLLIAQARQEADHLERLLAARTAGPRVSRSVSSVSEAQAPSVPAPSVSAPSVSAPSVSAPSVSGTQVTDTAIARGDSGLGEDGQQSSACPSRGVPVARMPGSPAAQAEVYGLADEGRSAGDIARHVGIPLGEVELILSLRGTGPGAA